MLNKRAATPVYSLFSEEEADAVQILAAWENARHVAESQACDSQPYEASPYGTITDSSDDMEDHRVPVDHTLSTPVPGYISSLLNFTENASRHKETEGNVSYFPNKSHSQLSTEAEDLFLQINNFANHHKQAHWKSKSCTIYHPVPIMEARLFRFIRELQKRGIEYIQFGTTNRVSIQGIKHMKDICGAFENSTILSHQHDRKRRAPADSLRPY